MKITLLIFVIALYAGCRPTDVEPAERTSFSYRTDGSRRIMPVAAPKVTSTLQAGPSVVFSTTPLPLNEEKGFAVGTKQGEVIIFGANDSIQSQTTVLPGDPIYRLAITKDLIVALHNSGSLSAIGYDGKLRWQTRDSLRRSDMDLSSNGILVIADGGIIRCIDPANGAKRFQIATTLLPTSIASDGNVFYVALSWNATSGSDSIYKISASGAIESRWGFPGARITSNIALAGDEKHMLVFGIQGELDASGVRRRTFIIGFDPGSKTKQILRQELEYIPTNISISGDIALASGFQLGGEEYKGAVDAFLLSANEKMWQRRFTEALATPVAVTTQHAFFTLTFTSAADIPSNALFYALDLATGETAREVGVTDARNGFVPGLPIPYKGALLLADALNATIYKLTVE